jgi:hypothetical protein
MFRNVQYPKRKNQTNRYKKKKIRSFQMDVSPKVEAYLDSLAKHKDRSGRNSRSRFINQAIEMFYLMKSKNKFLREIIKIYGLGELKHLIRVIGKERANKVRKIKKKETLQDGSPD